MKSTEIRKRMMKTAWQIFRRSTLTWRGSMLKAWMLVKATIAMTKGRVEFLYRKMDGTFRKAVGTLADLPYTSKGRKGTKSPHSTVCYWDLEKAAFRSFRVENFILAKKSV